MSIAGRKKKHKFYFIKQMFLCFNIIGTDDKCVYINSHHFYTSLNGHKCKNYKTNFMAIKAGKNSPYILSSTLLLAIV